MSVSGDDCARGLAPDGLPEFQSVMLAMTGNSGERSRAQKIVLLTTQPSSQLSCHDRLLSAHVLVKDSCCQHYLYNIRKNNASVVW